MNGKWWQEVRNVKRKIEQDGIKCKSVLGEGRGSMLTQLILQMTNIEQLCF